MNTLMKTAAVVVAMTALGACATKEEVRVAITTAERAEAKADRALSTADQAMSAASRAQSTADQALRTAQGAETAARAADEKSERMYQRSLEKR